MAKISDGRKGIPAEKERQRNKRPMIIGNVIGHTFIEEAESVDTLFKLLMSKDYESVNIGILIEDEKNISGRITVRVQSEFTDKVEYFDIKNHNQYRDLTIRKVSKSDRLIIDIESPEPVRGIWITVVGNARI